MSRYKLLRDDEGLGLEDRYSGRRPLRIDFESKEFLLRLRSASVKTELIARAVKAAPGLRVLDCTAGLGRDGFILAHLGCQVTMCERSIVLGKLLEDGLSRARSSASLQAAVRNISLLQLDALTYLQEHRARHDVIYVDPMFPSRIKSALAKGAMQYLQEFIGKDEDVIDLLDQAFASGSARIVLKRPAHSTWQSPRKPSHVLASKTSRFEVYFQPS